MAEAIAAIGSAAAPAGGGAFGVAALLSPPPRPHERAAGAPAAKAPAAADVADALAALRRVADALAQQTRTAGAGPSFRVGDALERLVVTVTDRRDGALLRQIPSGGGAADRAAPGTGPGAAHGRAGMSRARAQRALNHGVSA